MMTPERLPGGEPVQLGAYRVLRRLGSGGMGVVYLATEASGQQVAIKLLRPELGADEQFRHRFRREVQAARRVSGICTARYLDADTEGSQPFLVTEYLPGPTLTEAVEGGGALSQEQLLALMAGLAEALIAIHGAGVIHRDLKPSNVILTIDGPRVIDFGIARAFEGTSMTHTGAVLGSPAWMAPEQAAGKPVTTATDVFALGATIAYAGTGNSPFGEGAPQAVLYRIVHQPPSLAGLDPAVADTVMKSLEKDPTRRPTPRAILQVAASQTIGAVASNSAAETTVAAILARTWHQGAAYQPAMVAGTGRQRRWRFAALLAPVLLGGGVAMGVVLSGGESETADDSEPRNGSKDTTAATRPTTSATVAEGSPPPSPDDPASYYTTNGTLPRLAPQCNGLFGLCLGSPIERATALFGLEKERHGSEGTIYRYWDVGPVSVSVSTDEADSITSISGSIASEYPNARLSLPDGLVLGKTTMAEVVQVKGKPFDTDVLEGENLVFYSYRYREGGEGHELVSFGVGGEAGSKDDPGGFNDALRNRLVESFEAGYWADKSE